MRHQMTFSEVRELVVDNFAGGGGASTGIALAIGRSVDIAINHDPGAIAMHRTNHPDTKHLCESVWDVNPRKVTQGHLVGLCWLSPDCTHFSKAKGGKPVKKSIRGLAWVAVRWAATVRPRVIMLENVEEFVTWGPLIKGADGEMRPDPKRKGREFNCFVNALKRQGYHVEWTALRACDYGAPTIRRRLFLVARRDGLPIVWPEPTHGDPKSEAVKSGRLKPWRTAADIIDWSLPCPSIFERKKPLAENTMRRIARGVWKFVINNPSPFIVRIGQTGFGGDRMQYPVDQPLTTITSKAEHLLVTSVIDRQFTRSTANSADEPLGTVTAGGSGKSNLVTAFLAQYNTETPSHFTRGQAVDDPLFTVPTANRYGLVTSQLVKLRGTCADGQPVTEPMPTVTAGGLHVGEVRAFLQRYFGPEVKHERAECDSADDRHGSSGGAPERGSLEDSKDNQSGPGCEDHAKAGGVQAEKWLPGDQGLCEQPPVSGPGASGGMVGSDGRNTGQHGLEPQGRQQEEQRSRELGSSDSERELEACSGYRLEGLREPGESAVGGSYGTSNGRRELFTDCPEAGGVANDGLPSGHREVVGFLTKWYGTAIGQECSEPLHTVTSKHRLGLVTVEGQDYQIVDIGMRMLEPRELFNAQGFPSSYLIERDYKGRRYTKAEQVSRCGNAVPPPFAEALVRGNLPELCGERARSEGSA